MISSDWLKAIIEDAGKQLGGGAFASPALSLWRGLEDAAPMHAKFRRNCVQFVTMCGMIPIELTFPQLKERSGRLAVPGAQLCRDALLDLADSAAINNGCSRYERESTTFSAGAPVEHVGEPLALGAIASCLRYIRVPTQIELDPEFREEWPSPEWLALRQWQMFTQRSSDCTTEFWDWWLHDVASISIRPLEDLIGLLCDMKFTEGEMKRYTCRLS